MSKQGAVMAAAVFGLALSAGAGGSPGQASPIRLATALDAAQEVPAPTGDVSGARGTFTATATASGGGASLEWQLSFSGLTGPAGAAHIHIAPVGVSGPVAVPLCGPCQSPVNGTANVDASVLSALESGRAYVNVHTPTNGPGEIRGQIAVSAPVRTVLTSRQEVPRPRGNVRRATATFTAIVAKLGSSGTLAWRLTFSRLTGRAAAAHIHRGPRGRAGPVIVALCGPCRSGARGTANVQASVLRALQSGRAYVNVHTARNPAGEVRGQIAPVALTLS